MKMIEVENVSKETQAVSNIPEFKAGEKKSLPESQAKKVLGNPNFKAVEPEEKTKKTSSKK